MSADDDRYGRWYPLSKLVVAPFLKFLVRVYQPGISNVPVEGPAILAPNHISFLDSALLLATLPRQIKFVGKAEYLDDWKTKYLFPAMGMIPIDRAGGSASNSALDAARRVLDDGGLFGIFPEGTRSRDGRLHKGHTGMARLALQTGAPIVPVGIIGTREIQPPDAPFPRPFMPATLHFGRPIHVERYAAQADDRMVLRQITDEVMFEIRELTGQTYANTYATRSPESERATVATPTAPVTPAEMAASA
ncbi:MAG: lysophospholipid acyltransferase family protein [Actinomycetota bacterium]|nr:lysophospholipid acyltransferase family protein [Actinomycetota bacterium]